jgi:hypothetical protein
LATGKMTRLSAKHGYDIGYGHYSPDENQYLRTYVRYPSWSGDNRQLADEFNKSRGNIVVATVE